MAQGLTTTSSSPRRLARRHRPAGVVVVLTTLLAANLGGCSADPAPVPSRSGTPSSSSAPTPAAETVEQEAVRRVGELTLRQKVASVLMLHAPGTDPATLHDFMTQTGAGGFILMGDNVGGTADTVAATSAGLVVDPELPPLVGIDEEGGVVARLDEDTLPAAPQLIGEPPEATRDAFAARASLVRSAGASINFGIVADVTADPSSFIADRVLGADPASSAERVEQAVLGERGQVLSTLKHFPGHGRSDADSHTEIPQTDVSFEEWRGTDAVPFERGAQAGAEAVMFGHLAYTSVDGAPASLSPRWHEILRDDLGFDGLAVTDDMLMLQHTGLAEFGDPTENAIRALDAGNDLLLYVLAADPAVSGVDPAALLDGLTAAVSQGRIPQQRLDEAATRVVEARIRVREGL